MEGREIMDIIEKKNIPFSPPDIGEEEINGVINTLKSGWITTGPKPRSLKEELLIIVILQGQYV